MPISKNGKPYFTDEQYDKARYESSALEYAMAQGYDLVKRGAYYSLREHDSMVFDRNGRWFWNSRNIEGGAIEFMTIYEQKSYVEAILTLSGENIHTQQPAPTYARRENAASEAERKPFQLPERNDNDHRVTAYLTQTRGIDPEIVRALFRQGKLYESQGNHNAIFVFQNGADKAVGAFARGTYTQGKTAFRGMTAGSDRSTGFFCFGSKEATVACVFEAAIDAASYASLRMGGGEREWEKRLYMASGGAGDANVLAFLHAHPKVETVVLCQDNDDAGHRQAADVGDKLRLMGYIISRATPKGKDFNEDLLAFRETRKAQPEPIVRGAAAAPTVPDPPVLAQRPVREEAELGFMLD